MQNDDGDLAVCFSYSYLPTPYGKVPTLLGRKLGIGCCSATIIADWCVSGSSNSSCRLQAGRWLRKSFFINTSLLIASKIHPEDICPGHEATNKGKASAESMVFTCS